MCLFTWHSGSRHNNCSSCLDQMQILFREVAHEPTRAHVNHCPLDHLVSHAMLPRFGLDYEVQPDCYLDLEQIQRLYCQYLFFLYAYSFDFAASAVPVLVYLPCPASISHSETPHCGSLSAPFTHGSVTRAIPLLDDFDL